MDIFDYIAKAYNNRLDNRIILSQFNGEKIDLLHTFMQLNSSFSTLHLSLPSGLSASSDFKLAIGCVMDSFYRFHNIISTLMPVNLVAIPIDFYSAMGKINSSIPMLCKAIEMHCFLNADLDVPVIRHELDVIEKNITSLCLKYETSIVECLEAYEAEYGVMEEPTKEDSNYQKQMIAKVILEATFRTAKLPSTIEEMEVLLEEHPENVIEFPEDVKDYVLERLGFDPSESPRIMFSGNLMDNQHKI